MHMQALAMVAEGSVTVLSHPSFAGISSGSGISGSTAWHGAFRFRQYLKGIKGRTASSQTTIFANSSLKKPIRASGRTASRFAIRAACSFPRAAWRAWIRRHATRGVEDAFLAVLGRYERTAGT